MYDIIEQKQILNSKGGKDLINKDNDTKILESMKIVDNQYCAVCDSNDEVQEFKGNYICLECIKIVKSEFV